MNTQNQNNDARPSGQTAAGSAQKVLTTPEEIGKALGASSSVPVSSLRDPMSLLGQGLALAHRQQKQTTADLLLEVVLRGLIQRLTAAEIQVAFGNTTTVGEDGAPFIRVTPVVLGFVKKALLEALEARAYAVVPEGKEYLGSKPILFLGNKVLDRQGDPVCVVSLEAGGVTGKISVWLSEL